MRRVLILFTLLFAGFSFAQNSPEDTLVERLQVYESIDLPVNFHSEYRTMLNRVRRVYPLALEAARVIDSLELALENENKKRKQKKMMKTTHKDLKQDFKFVIKDLYVSDGKVLTKLIYRETGMTVREIISKYRSGAQASIYSSAAWFFDQDLDAVYLPETDDFVLECVILDIMEGKVAFDPSVNLMDKQEYKESTKAYKERRKTTQKNSRIQKKEMRKKEKEEKKKKPQN